MRQSEAMQMFLLVVGVLCLFSGGRGHDCAPPKPGDKAATSSQCCKKERKLPEVMKENIPKCNAKYPLPEPMKGPEVRSALVCTAECVFKESGFLKPDGKIDIPAFKKIMAATYPDQKNSSANIDKCIAATASRIDHSSDCKSGAFELGECFRRNCFLHCPKDLWTASKECEDLRKKIEMCPAYPVIELSMPE